MIRLAPLAALCLSSTTLLAQLPADLARERAAYAEWLATAANSPYLAVAQQPIGPGLRIGPAGSDLPLEGVPEQRITQQGAIVALEGPGGRRVLPRHRPVTLGRFTVVAGGTPGRGVLAVFAPREHRETPAYYPHSPTVVFEGPLVPADTPRTLRILAPDGVDVEATEAGTVVVPIGGVATSLRVMRIPDPGTGESELEIFFRDGTNGRGTYPAGRFVSLVPAGPGRWRLDFNRARNPFCAYSTAYACPAPWRGNAIPIPVEAGERYEAK
jgi:uncharacterized protein